MEQSMLQITSGAWLWSYETDVNPTKASPIVSNGLVYGGGQKALYALDSHTGALRWQYTPPKGEGIDSASTMAHGVIYVESGGGTEKKPQTFLSALDAVTGALRWKLSWPSWDAALNDFPVVEQGIVCVIVGNTLQALDAQDGHVLWKYRKSIFSPLAGDNNLIYAAIDGLSPTSGTTLQALNVVGGSLRWATSLEPGILKILVQGSILYAATDSGSGRVYALNAENGKILWRTDLSRSSNAYILKPLLAGNELYVGAEGSAGDDPYLLHVLNAQNGEENWYASFSAVSAGNMLSIAG